MLLMTILIILGVIILLPTAFNVLMYMIGSVIEFFETPSVDNNVYDEDGDYIGQKSDFPIGFESWGRYDQNKFLEARPLDNFGSWSKD